MNRVHHCWVFFSHNEQLMDKSVYDHIQFIDIELNFSYCFHLLLIIEVVPIFAWPGLLLILLCEEIINIPIGVRPFILAICYRFIVYLGFLSLTHFHFDDVMIINCDIWPTAATTLVILGAINIWLIIFGRCEAIWIWQRIGRTRAFWLIIIRKSHLRFLRTLLLFLLF